MIMMCVVHSVHVQCTGRGCPRNKTRHAVKWPMDVTNWTDHVTDELNGFLEWPLATKNGDMQVKLNLNHNHYS